MQQHFGTTWPLRTPSNGPDGVYTTDNTDDNLHDVVLRETGQRYGVNWLQPVVELEELEKIERGPSSHDAINRAFHLLRGVADGWRSDRGSDS